MRAKMGKAIWEKIIPTRYGCMNLIFRAYHNMVTPNPTIMEASDPCQLARFQKTPYNIDAVIVAAIDPTAKTEMDQMMPGGLMARRIPRARIITHTTLLILSILT